MKWRYESMVESVCQALNGGGYGPEVTKKFLMHLASKIYEMGKEDATPRETIPITDLSYIPEVLANVQHRWGKGVAN